MKGYFDKPCQCGSGSAFGERRLGVGLQLFESLGIIIEKLDHGIAQMLGMIGAAPSTHSEQATGLYDPAMRARP